MALTGRTIAIAEGRQLEELALMLEKEGAKTLRCPMLSILDHPDSGAVAAWLHELIAGKFTHLVLFTGEGLRRLLGVAERHGLREQTVEALGKVKTITRGPKPVLALKEIGLAPYKIASAPTTDGIIATLEQESLSGAVLGVQLYIESNPPLFDYFTSKGIEARYVLPYVYAPLADAHKVVNLIADMANGAIDCIVFTSSPQIDRLCEIAREHKLEESLATGWTKVKVASVGPLVTDKLIEIGARADIAPAQGFQMKNLVQHIKRAFE